MATLAALYALFGCGDSSTAPPGGDPNPAVEAGGGGRADGGAGDEPSAVTPPVLDASSGGDPIAEPIDEGGPATPATDAAVDDARPLVDSAVKVDSGPPLDWTKVHNPIFAADGWSVKDVAVVYAAGTYYFFFSAFFTDTGQERCHVATTASADLRTFEPPHVVFDGQKAGWAGMCSPDVVKVGTSYVMSFNSWGDLANKPNQLFYSTSTDLRVWSPEKALAPTFTAGNRAIDAALAVDDARVFLFWKERTDQDRTRVVSAAGIDGPWHVVGGGFPTLLMENGADNGKTHENFQILRASGTWHLLSTDYDPHEPYLYTLTGAGQNETDFLSWSHGYVFNIAKETFNTDPGYLANAAYLMDARARDGFFYLFYAGSTEHTTHAGRGDNKIGVSRAADLKSWKPAGM